MNWYEVKLVTLQKLFSADTTEIVIDDTTMPYLSAMPGAANACLNYIASTVRHITKSITIEPTTSGVKQYHLKELAPDFYSLDTVYFGDNLLKTYDYRFIGTDTLLADSNGDKITVLYKAYPEKITADTGMDVLTHAIESYVSNMASDYTDGLALNAIKLVFNYLPRAYKDGSDVEARQHMANASCMAGMAFANAFLGVNHSLAHKLGALHHIPHGIANALVLLHVLRYNAAEVPAKMGTFPQYQYPHTLARYAEIGRSVGLTGKNDSEVFEKLLQKLQELMDTIEIKHTIREYGVDEKYFLETLDEMTEQAFNDQCTCANPRYPLMSELKEIYLKAYYGEGNVPESRKAKEKKETK